MADELKPGPCPFCGRPWGKVSIHHILYRVRCTVCAAEGPYCSTEAEAVSQWNACNKAQLLAACKAQLDLFESWKEGIFTRLGIQWEVEPEAVTMARAAIAAAEVKP